MRVTVASVLSYLVVRLRLFYEDKSKRKINIDLAVVASQMLGGAIYDSEGNIMHEVEYNVYHKGHQERMCFDVCNLGRTEVILGMPWLAAHNPEIDWEKGEVKITRCLPWYGKDNRGKKAREKQEKVKRREEKRERWRKKRQSAGQWMRRRTGVEKRRWRSITRR